MKRRQEKEDEKGESMKKMRRKEKSFFSALSHFAPMSYNTYPVILIIGDYL